jgi:hypothetical protein
MQYAAFYPLSRRNPFHAAAVHQIVATDICWHAVFTGRAEQPRSECGGHMRKVYLLLGVLAISTVSWAQSNARPEILVLGTYHMSNPGHDIYNMQADDVLSPRRQQEIAQLIEVLKRFRPTKVAIESEVGSQQRVAQYSDYLAGKHTLSHNEIDQIGYRLAKELGHRTIYAVDVDGDFPILRVINYAKANGRAEKFDAIGARTGARVKEEDGFLRSHTVLEMLEYMNSDSMVARSVADYFAYVPYGEPWEYAGPDLLASWYQRNIRIYHNIVTLIESPNDRILVIYGAGHLGWLRQDIANDATVKLRKLADLTGRQ